jgi:hypothetical protein
LERGLRRGSAAVTKVEVRGRWQKGQRLACSGCAALAAVALLGLAPSAAAAELAIEAPVHCLDEDELSFRVERLLGQPLAGVEAMQLSVRIEPLPQGFGARLVVVRPGSEEGGTRSLRAASCAELSESLALAIAVAIGAAAEPAEPAPAVSTRVEPAAAPVDTPVAAAAAPPEPSAPGPALSGSAWMVGDTGTLPAPGLGVAAGLGVSWPGVGLRAIGTLLPEREATVAATDSSSPGARIGLMAGSALACVPIAVNSAALGLAACGGWEVGQLAGNGTHVSVPYHQRRLWSAARFDLMGHWALADTAVALELLVTAAAPFTRDDFIVKDIGSVHRPANVVGRLGVGLSLSTDR